MSERQAVSRVLRPIAIGAAVLCVLGLTLYGLLYRVSAARARAAEAVWAEKLGSVDDVLARYPSRESNESALELERLAARLGIDLVPRGVGARPRPADAEESAWKAVAGDLQRFLVDEAEGQGLGPPTPPSAVVDYLHAYREPIGAVVTHLTTVEPPLWYRQTELLFEAPIPNLLGILTLHRLLAAEALRRSAAADMSGAAACLDASWQLDASLRDEPFLIEALISIAAVRLQLGVLRHVEVDATLWRERLASVQPRETLTRTLDFEAWTWTRLDRPAVTYNPTELHRAAFRLAAPYVRLCAADSSDRMRREIERLAQLDYLCDRDLAAAGADLRIDVPFWNRFGNILVPNLADTVVRTARLEVDLEFADRLLALRELRGLDGGWPAEFPADWSLSAACPGDRWIYAPRPGGGMRMEFSRTPGFPEAIGAVLPIVYEAHAAP